MEKSYLYNIGITTVIPWFQWEETTLKPEQGGVQGCRYPIETTAYTTIEITAYTTQSKPNIEG
jgi:hypothetical protein